MNFDIFFPIQIWEFVDDNATSHVPVRFRLQCPNVHSSPTHYEFPDHFLDVYPNVSSALRRSWTFQRTIWVINPKYSRSFVHGYACLFVEQHNTEPYHTSFITESLYSRSGNDFYQGFSFSYLVYEADSCLTTLLYLNLSITNQLQDIVFVDKYGETDDRNEKYNFLPFQKNKDIPFYEIQSLDKNLYLYIFLDKPEGIYWYMNPSHICLPTTEKNSSSFMTSFECFEASSKRRNPTFPLLYLQDPLQELSMIMENPDPVFSQEEKTSSMKTIFIVMTVFSLVLLLIVIVDLRRVKTRYQT